MSQITVGFAMCGSFCTFHKVIPEIENLVQRGYRVLPILSQTAYTTDTRFGKAADFNAKIEEITGNPIIHTIYAAEPIGPKKLLDALIVAPATGNTIAKLANGITDTSVTLACKAHLRNCRPVLLAVSTNDALGTAAKNKGLLMHAKHLYYVPMRQDDTQNKPNSVVADFAQIVPALEAALEDRQIQPIYK